MGLRGAPRGSKQQKWTETEWGHIRHALIHGNPRTRAADLMALLPGRSRSNIHNALNTERRRQARTCIGGCNATVDEAGTRCDACKDIIRQRRLAKIKSGCCTTCGDSLDKGSSATRCSMCSARRGTYRHNRALKTT